MEGEKERDTRDTFAILSAETREATLSTLIGERQRAVNESREDDQTAEVESERERAYKLIMQSEKRSVK